MPIKRLIAKLGIPDQKFSLKQSYFDRLSRLHGISHTYRVMTHCLTIGAMTGHERETLLAFCGAYVHDMARQHDGRCEYHGQWAAERKVPLFLPLFREAGMKDDEADTICRIVTAHSIPAEPIAEKADPALSILKDADALDRIRLGEDNLKPEYLRLDISHKLIEFSRELFYATNDAEPESFEDCFSAAEELLRNCTPEKRQST